MADTSAISMLRTAATPTFQQPQAAPAATGAATTAAPAAAGAATAAGTTAQAQPAATEQSQPKDPGPVALDADGAVKTTDDTMSWLRGQMARPRVQASPSQSQSLSDLHARLLAAQKTMLDMWLTSS